MVKRQILRLTESDLHRIVKESVDGILKEISAQKAFDAASGAYRKAREGFGKYTPSDTIPNDSYHGRKFAQGEKFTKYMQDKIGYNDGYSIYYPNGDGSVMVLKDKNGKVVTKPCRSIEELEAEYKRIRNR